VIGRDIFFWVAKTSAGHCFCLHERSERRTTHRYFLMLEIGLDDLARAKFRRFEDRFRSGVPELTEVGALDVLELHLQHARLRPFAVLAKGDFANDRVEWMTADVIGELALAPP
jgi:hypothetical protein